MMKRITVVLASVLAVMACDDSGTTPTTPFAEGSQQVATVPGGRAGALGAVYVRSQGLYYDTFVTSEALPMEGDFQKLENGVTEYGPGDAGYRGGRWWVDVNGNGVQDAADRFFLCPLLPPGRSTP